MPANSSPRSPWPSRWARMRPTSGLPSIPIRRFPRQYALRPRRSKERLRTSTCRNAGRTDGRPLPAQGRAAMTGDVVRLACLALMFGLAAVPAAAEEFYGPLRIRDMGPFQILRLNMLPDHALAPSAGRVGLEVQVSHSNTFVMDTDIHAYLERRGARREIGPRDVTAIAALGEDTFLFDGELGYAKATGHYAFTDRLSGYVSVPFHYFGGGYFDSAIENFHDMFGFDSFGREYISRNDFQAVATIDGETFALLERPTSGGIGDPVLGLRYYIPLRNHSAVTFELAHKFAFQDPDKFRTTGSDDSGAQISWHVHGLKNSFYTSVAV